MKTRNKKFRPVLGGILLICIVVTYTLYEPKLPSVPNYNDDQLRVVSYNLKYGSSDMTLWQKRKILITQQILAYKSDVIGIQEGDSAWMSETDGLPALLSGYKYVGVGREDGVKQGEYAAIFYDYGKYELVDQGTFWLSETMNEPSIGWDADTYRICTWVELRNRTSGRVFRHYNTHFDHKGSLARKESTNLILKTLENVETPFVLTGDFNFYEGSSNYKKLTQGDSLRDSKHLAEDTMSYGTLNWFLPINLSLIRPIDFCFVSHHRFKVQTYRVDNTYKFDGKPVSDHYPVVVDLIFK